LARRAASTVLDALKKLLFLAFDAVDLDPGLLGEVGVQRFVGLIVARGIEVQDFFFSTGSADKGGGEQGAGEWAGNGLEHGLAAP
jgi:hypothetical protein